MMLFDRIYSSCVHRFSFCTCVYYVESACTWNREARAALRREDQNKEPVYALTQLQPQAFKMPSEKGKSRGRKRKGMVEASEGTEESQDPPLTQGKGEKYVPRFSTKRTRNTRAKAKPCTPAEKLQLAENAATDQSGEVWRNSECKQSKCVGHDHKLVLHFQQAT